VHRIAQGGAVVVKLDGPEPRFLLVKARRDPNVWIFPKGHVEAGETPDQTAVRETQEEAGVIGRVLAPLGFLEFESGGRPLHVDYFLVEAIGETEEHEGRTLAWGTYEETRDRIEFDNARELLATARNRLANL